MAGPASDTTTTAPAPAPAPAAAGAGIARRRSGRYWSYRIDGAKVPGVTTITGYFKSGGLADYPANQTAEYAVNNWATLDGMPPADRLKALYAARWAEARAAAATGTEVHKIARLLHEGQAAEYPPELGGYVESCVAFLDATDPKVIAAELAIGNRTHRYCGTLDLIADLGPVPWDGSVIPASRWLLDLKTAKSGIFGETALQTCAYANAEAFIAENGDERPMHWLGIQRCGAVHIRADGWDLYPLDTGPDTWTYFTSLAWLYHAQEAKKEWVGPAAGPFADPAAQSS
jgi:hypothetical protein